MTYKRFLPLLAALLLLAGCKTPENVIYFQDLENGSDIKVPTMQEILVEPGDKISIVVNSKDAELADMFNLSIVSHRVGYTRETSLSTNQQVSCYTVDSKGNIDFPVIGDIQVAGLNREAIATLVKETLAERGLLNDAVVTVEFANLCISILGEVSKPGRYNIERDHVTLIDAISMAGDLTINGMRENVLVIRETDAGQKAYRVDLTSAESLSNSPAYFIQQNDVVYVVPNDMRIRQSTVNGNNLRNTSFWISLGSLLTSIATLIINID